MKLLYDFFPLLVFFIFYKATNIFVATGALIVATAVQLVLMWVKFKRVETMHVVTFVLVLVFGGLTIWLHDAMFLKWKVSIVNWLFGAAFLLTQFIGKRTLVEMLMNAQIQLPKFVWKRLNTMWGVFFILMGTLNIYVVYHYSTATWVDFKVFGMLGLTVIFIIIQTAYLYRYLKHNVEQQGKQ